MLDAVVDFLPSPLDIPPAEGTDLKGENIVERKADENAPFAALAFKIVADPFGKLTYFRVYSGMVNKGDEVYNSTKDRKRAPRAHPADARQPARRPRRGHGRRHRGRPRLQADHHRRHAVRPGQPDRARAHGVPGARHPRGHRAEDQGRPGQAGQGPLLPLRGGPDLPRPHRRGDRPDRHLRHGRAAPRGAGRPHAARVQRRRHRRQAAGRLPRDHHQARPAPSSTATSSRRAAPASSPSSRSTSSRPVPAAGTSSSTRSRGGRVPARVHPGRGPGHPVGARLGRARRLPDRRRPRDARRRPVPRRRLERAGLQDRRLDGVQEGRRDRPAGAARADHVGRGA